MGDEGQQVNGWSRAEQVVKFRLDLLDDRYQNIENALKNIETTLSSHKTIVAIIGAVTAAVVSGLVHLGLRAAAVKP